MDQGQTQAPSDEQLRALGSLYEQGDYAETVRQGRVLLDLYPDCLFLLNLMGVCQLAVDQPLEAIDYFRRAVETDQNFADALHNLGVAFCALERKEEAVQCYRRAAKLNPGAVETQLALGRLLGDLGRHGEAAACYAHSLDVEPDNVEALGLLGSTLVLLGRKPDAFECFRQLAELRPDSAETHNNLASALNELGHKEEAVAFYRRAIALKPDYPIAQKNLGNALSALGRKDEAIASYEAALALNPADGTARAQRLYLLAEVCDWGAIAAEADLIPWLGIEGDAISPFTMLGFEDRPERHRLRSERFCNAEHQAVEARAWAIPAHRPDKLKIGYFSADFHNHATMYLMAGLFEAHDSHRFEVHAYSYGPDKDDDMRRRLQAAAAFHDVRFISDAEIASLARDHEIDIAVDLKGYTQHTRTGIFAHRAAPVQMSYLGYPGTMGAPFIDYIVADRMVIPDGARGHYSEEIIYLPNSYQVNDSKRAISPDPVSRAEAGLPDGAFVFCCFNNSYKIGPAEFDIWMRLLHRVEGSVLWMLKSNRWAEANLRREAGRRGIDPDRLIFADPLPLPRHLARQQLADLFLDTFNYNAHTTASDALWAGLPVVTRLGKGFAARVGGSLLNAIGMNELITDTEHDYERLALELALDPARLGLIRSRIWSNGDTAPLFDSALFARHIEEAYQQAYQLHFEGKPPRMIIV